MLTYPHFSDNKSQAYCEDLANKMSKLQDLPAYCRKYDDVVKKMESKQQKDAVDPFAGMRPGEAVRARAARTRGMESHAQIQRRHTTRASRAFSKLDK